MQLTEPLTRTSDDQSPVPLPLETTGLSASDTAESPAVSTPSVPITSTAKPVLTPKPPTVTRPQAVASDSTRHPIKSHSTKSSRQRQSRLLVARLKFWGWTFFTKTTLTIIYLDIVSQGIVSVFPDMGKRFWKIPGFAFLNDFEATHRITIAHVFTIIPLLATWILWAMLLRMHLASDRFDESLSDYATDRIRRVVALIGVTIITCDAGLFAASFSMSSWGASRFSATAVLATGMYIAVLAFVSLFSLFLGDAVTTLTVEDQDT